MKHESQNHIEAMISRNLLISQNFKNHILFLKVFLLHHNLEDANTDQSK